MKVSIIIPTYNRSHTLRITLASLIAQHYPDHAYEIIVVDNNSTDDTCEVVGAFTQDSPVSVIYALEARQGAHHARHTGARQASGEILYYTDDDMRADPDLIRSMVAAFELDPKIGSVTGRVLPEWEVEPPDWILKYCKNGWLSLNDRPEELVIAPYDVKIYSCHMAIRRELMFDCKGFNPDLVDGVQIGDGETGLNIKVKERGYKFAYTGAAVTYHLIPKTRLTQRYFNDRLAKQGNADSFTAYRQFHFRRRQLVRRIVLHVVKLLGHIVRCGRDRILLKDMWRAHRAYVTYYTRRIVYDYRLLRDGALRQFVVKPDWMSE